MVDFSGLNGIDGEELLDFARSCPKLRELVMSDEEWEPWDGGDDVVLRTQEQLAIIREVVGVRAREWHRARGLPASLAAAASMVAQPARSVEEMNQATAGMAAAVGMIQAGVAEIQGQADAQANAQPNPAGAAANAGADAGADADA